MKHSALGTSLIFEAARRLSRGANNGLPPKPSDCSRAWWHLVALAPVAVHGNPSFKGDWPCKAASVAVDISSLDMG